MKYPNAPGGFAWAIVGGNPGGWFGTIDLSPEYSDAMWPTITTFTGPVGSTATAGGIAIGTYTSDGLDGVGKPANPITLTPDIPGQYVITLGPAFSAYAQTLTIQAFSSAIYAAVLANVQRLDPHRGDADVQTVLRSISPRISSAQLTAWLASPSQPPVKLSDYGGSY